jgi:hypothetical protein
MLPLLPNKDIAARDLCPLKEGRIILKNITNKDLQPVENNKEWLITIEKQWQLLSSRNDICDNYNIARQKLSNAVQIQRDLKIHISKQRCLAITETDDKEQWRLWQLVKIEQTLAQLLIDAYAKKDAKKIATMLFIVADKFFTACTQFSQLEIQLPLALNNLALEENKIIFTGFVLADANVPQIDPEHCIKKAFQGYISQLSNDPAIKVSLISYYLTVYAHENPTSKMLVTILVKLFK